MAYPVTVDPLHTVFSPYGVVQKMAIFEKNNQWQVCWEDASLFLSGQCLHRHDLAPTLRHALSCQWSQALVQYSNAAEAASAKASLEGHAIYDGGYNRVGGWWLIRQ